MDETAVRTALGVFTLEQGSKTVLFCETELPGMFDRGAQQYLDTLAEAGVTVQMEDLQRLKQPVLDDVRRYLERRGMIS